ncbi:hypothetical protein IMSAG025_00597 [Muribaculaceae bacterium]|nr:hypothetical protein IMSAG025_00597 [Muribaculaceae bacterium]
MCRYGRGTSELCIGMHTSHGIRHTIGSRTCRHIVRVKGTSCTAAGSNGGIFLSLFVTFFFVCTCNRMLESCRVGGVTCNGNVNTLFMHNSNAFAYIVCAIAVYFCTKPFRIRFSENFFYCICIRIILCLYKSKTIDSGNYLCGIFSKSVQDNP